MTRSQKHFASMAKALLFLAILRAFLGNFAIAEQRTFESRSFNFKLSYPDSFREVPASNALNALTLKTKESDYPTFNIVVQPGSETVRKESLKTLSEQILDSYKNSGFLGATLLESKIVKLKGRYAIECQLEYSIRGLAYNSLVVMIPTQSRSFILTYIDTKQNFRNEIHLGREIFASIELGDPPASSEPRASAQNTWFWPILGILITAAFIYWLKPRLTSSEKS